MGDSEARFARERAKQWLTSRDFRVVCDLADLAPDPVRAAILAAYNKRPAFWNRKPKSAYFRRKRAA